MTQQKPRQKNRQTTHRTFRLGMIIMVGITVSLGAIASKSDGQDHTALQARDPALPAALRIVRAQASCYRCMPEATTVDFHFDAPVSPAQLISALEVQPAITLRADSTDAAEHIQLTADFAEHAAYRFTLPSGFSGGGARITDRNVGFVVRTGGIEREILIPVGATTTGSTRTMPLILRAIPEARVRVLRLRPSEVARARMLTGYRPDVSDPIADLPAAMQRRVQTHMLSGHATEDRTHQVDALGAATGRGFGAALVVVDAPESPPRSTVVQRGGLAVQLKTGRRSGLVWVTDTARGTAARGVQVRIYDNETLRFSGVSDSSGTVTLPGLARLLAGEQVWSRTLTAVASQGSRLAFASQSDGTGIQGYQFGLPYGESAGVRGMVTTERGIYRPGEEVHLWGVLQRAEENGALSPLTGRVAVEVRDPDYNPIKSARVRLTRFGSLRLPVQLEDTAQVGRYHVIVTGADRSGEEKTFRHSFDVGEYRANTFEVNLPPSGAAEFADGEFTVPISARYLYGAAVQEGEVEWFVTARASRPTADGLERFTFSSHAYDRPVARGTLSLDASGEGVIRVSRSDIESHAASGAIQLIVEASVSDQADDSVTSRTSQSFYPEGVAVGVRADRWSVAANEPITIRAAAVNMQGTLESGRGLEIQLVHHRWNSVAEATDHGTRYRGSYEDVVVEERTVQSGSTPSAIEFRPSLGGRYLVRARLAGSDRVSETRFWSYGAGEAGPMHNHPRIDLQLDQEDYRPGQTARVLVPSPFESALALLTVERDGVLSSTVHRLGEGTTALDLPVRSRYLPNAFVGVMLIPGGLDSASTASGVPIRVGYAKLSVDASSRRLSVELTPRRDEYEPSEEAIVDVVLKDAGGRPVSGEITVWAADEGVLSLTGYQTPDPFSNLYQPFGHQVTNASNLIRWTPEDPDEWYQGGGDGGDGGGSASAFRSRFLSTAFFSRPIVTDRRGRATVRIPLPDNLTRWRIMGAAVGTEGRFGSGEQSVRVHKPLQVMPSLPRFLTQGDELPASVVVHNNTGRSGTATVEFSVVGAELTGESTRTIEIADGGQVPVRFPLRANSLSPVEIRARVTLGASEDGFLRTLSVHPPTQPKSQSIGDGRVAEAAVIPVTIPDAVQAGTQEMILTVSRGPLASMEGGLDKLIHYPNGCLEQTTSKLIPMVLLEGLFESSGSTQLSGSEHRGRMNEAIAHVLRHQNSDGGFGLWPPSDSEGFLTAYGLWGLLTAQARGYEINQSKIDRGIAYLRSHATEGDDMHGQFNGEDTAAFGAFVLSFANQDGSGIARTLLGERGVGEPGARGPGGGGPGAGQQSVSRFGMGLLSQAFEEGATEVAPIFTSILSTQTRGANGASLIPSTTEGTFSYGAPVRSTASAAWALTQSGRVAEAEPLIMGILEERRPEGDWGSTYNNLWALYALTHYAEAVDRAEGASQIGVNVDGQQVAVVELAADERLTQVILSASSLPEPGAEAALTFTQLTGPDVRYSARLTYVESAEDQAAESHGLSITRAYFDAESGARVTSPRVGQTLRVELTADAAENERQIAVTDFLPAGFEPIDTGLASSSTRHRDRGTRGTFFWQEIHDERVAMFANRMRAGGHVTSYLVRVSREGTFTAPAPQIEHMYNPERWGRGAISTVTVSR